MKIYEEKKRTMIEEILELQTNYIKKNGRNASIIELSQDEYEKLEKEVRDGNILMPWRMLNQMYNSGEQVKLFGMKIKPIE